jgi:hypothetical protein
MHKNRFSFGYKRNGLHSKSFFLKTGLDKMSLLAYLCGLIWKTRSLGTIYHEKNVPTIEPEAEKQARLPRADVNR